MDKEEEWRDCELYPNYVVSDQGNVVRKKDRLLLKQYLQKSGYVYLHWKIKKEKKMDRREELVVLSGQIINGIMSSDSSFLTKLFDRTLHEGAARITVDLARKILQEIDKS